MSSISNGMDVHKEATVIGTCAAERQWQAGHPRSRSWKPKPAAFCSLSTRSCAGRVACDLGRRDLGGLALRVCFATPGDASAGLRSAAQCLIKGRQQKRQDRCAQATAPTCCARACCARSTMWRTRQLFRGRCASWGAVIQTISQDLNRVMNRIESFVSRLEHSLVRVLRSMLRVIANSGYRGSSMPACAGRAELLYQQLDGLQGLRRTLALLSYWRRAGNIKPIETAYVRLPPHLPDPIRACPA